MSITEFSVLPVGARVRVRRGRFPMDPALDGRVGTVVESTPYAPHRINVALDDEAEIRAFAPSELEVLEGREALPPDHADARKRLARP